MAEGVVTAEKADRTPNWDKWRLIPNCTLWECIALSLDIDPDKVHKEWLEINLVIKESGKFNDRIAVALENAGDTGALRPTRHRRDGKWWAVSLREFAAWVHRIGWEAPPELLAIGDQRRQNVNWNYWGGLDLWPLDAACKLISGDNPNEPTQPGDIENPDIDNRPEWVNVYHQAVSTIKAGNLSVVNGEVTPAKFIAWVRRKGWDAPRELLAMADKQVAIESKSVHSGNRTATATAQRGAKKADRSRALKQFIEDVYEALDNAGHEIGEKGDREPLLVSADDLHTLFCVRHPEYKVAQSTFNDDLGTIATLKLGPKRHEIKQLAEMLAGKFSD